MPIDSCHILIQLHQPLVVFDTLTSNRTQFFWDANGNLAQTYDCNKDTTRFHQWDDVNRLRMVLGPSKGGFYGYDANGERVYKLFGDYNVVSTGYLNIGASFNIDDAVVYPNSFLTITPRGYTKHYFAGSERVATAWGDGQWIEDVPISAIKTTHDYNIIKTFEPLCSIFPLGYPNYEDIDINLDINGINQSPIQYCTNPYALKVLSLNFSYGLLYQTMSYYTENQGGSEKIFYYHGDHLGSASWITDSHCAPIQYLHYLPYGEIIANQNPSGIYNERFKFTGKELDEESGYYYFGARYLLSELGNFISSDPLSDKYPEIQSYLYCNGNPVMNIDPEGKDWYATTNDDGSQTAFWNDSHVEWLEKGGIKYNNIGAIYNYSIGNVSYSYLQNELQSISYSTNTTFIQQQTNTGCKSTCDNMVLSSGHTPYYGRQNEILMTTHDANGVVNGITTNIALGLLRIEDYIISGAPLIVGVDYRATQKYNFAPQGDGMTDHFITIVGMNINIGSGVTTYRFYDPGSVRGNNMNNIITFSNGFLTGKTAARGTPFTVTTIRANQGW